MVIAAVRTTSPSFAVIVTEVAVETGVVVPIRKYPVVLPAGTVIDDPTHASVDFELDRLTSIPP